MLSSFDVRCDAMQCFDLLVLPAQLFFFPLIIIIDFLPRPGSFCLNGFECALTRILAVPTSTPWFNLCSLALLAPDTPDYVLSRPFQIAVGDE